MRHMKDTTWTYPDIEDIESLLVDGEEIMVKAMQQNVAIEGPLGVEIKWMIYGNNVVLYINHLYLPPSISIE